MTFSRNTAGRRSLALLSRVRFSISLENSCKISFRVLVYVIKVKSTKRWRVCSLKIMSHRVTCGSCNCIESIKRARNSNFATRLWHLSKHSKLFWKIVAWNGYGTLGIEKRLPRLYVRSPGAKILRKYQRVSSSAVVDRKSNDEKF